MPNTEGEINRESDKMAWGHYGQGERLEILRHKTHYFLVLCHKECLLVSWFTGKLVHSFIITITHVKQLQLYCPEQSIMAFLCVCPADLLLQPVSKSVVFTTTHKLASLSNVYQYSHKTKHNYAKPVRIQGSTPKLLAAESGPKIRTLWTGPGLL